MTEKPNCLKCKWSRSIPGDAHKSCAHPSLFSDESIVVKGHRIGVEGGWFMFPFNFDPRWLLMCTGFEAKEEES